MILDGGPSNSAHPREIFLSRSVDDRGSQIMATVTFSHPKCGSFENARYFWAGADTRRSLTTLIEMSTLSFDARRASRFG
jgi:hypothetical protein